MKKSETVLITGGGGGIGLELARIFHARGYSLLVVSLLKEELVALKNELPPLNPDQSVTTVQQDLSQPGAAAMIFNYCEAENITIDILVNNAGIGIYGSHVDIFPGEMLTMLNLNIVTATELVTLFGEKMKKRGWGKILITASTASFQSLPMMAAYGASKTYLLKFARALDYELKASGVRVSVLCPGTTRTNFLNQAGIEKSDSKTSFGAIAHRVQADPAGVARAGYRGLMKNRRIIVPGLVNRIHYTGSRLLPGWLITGIAGRIFQRGYAEEGE